jgi:uncharacterized protein YecT (DUF1311 family)
MINNYLKTIGSILLVGTFLFLAFGSDDTKSSSNKSISSSNSKKSRTVYSGGYAVEIDLTPPAGCKEGAICSGCDGIGVTNYMGNDMICPSCNGKGFLWLEKSGLSHQTSDISVAEYSKETQTVNQEYDSTDSNEDVNDMSSNIKSADELEVADKKLNAIYKQVMALLNETEKTELRHEQRKWIKYRDISCGEETKDSKGGSLYNALLNNCEKEKTEKRIEELIEILESKE